MITLFELQSQSGQLWLEIVAHLEAKDTAHAAEASARNSAHAEELAKAVADLQTAAAEIELINLDHKAVVDAKAAELEATKAELADRNALIESAKTAIKGAIANPALDDTATVSTIAQVVKVAEMPAIEKRKLAIAAEIAAKQEELDALSTPEP